MLGRIIYQKAKEVNFPFEPAASPHDGRYSPFQGLLITAKWMLIPGSYDLTD
jgi:hypothetical protein